MACKILGCGGYLPKRIIHNDDLTIPNISSQWIEARTGILQRHIATKDEYASDFAYAAAIEAIEHAKINKNSIDLIIVCTTTPDNTFPSTAAKVQGLLQLNNNVAAFDLQAVSSGFIYGIHIAATLMQSAKYKTILLIATEKMSSLIDWHDQNSCILFGDGAGAIVLSTQHQSSNSQIVDSLIHSDGSLYDILYADGGVGLNNQVGKIRMNGRSVFRHAVSKMLLTTNSLLHNNYLTHNDIKYFIPHQANLKIINSVVSKLKINRDKVITTVSKHANCSAASIPLALKELSRCNTLQDGDLILMAAFGAGITWGGVLIRW